MDKNLQHSIEKYFRELAKHCRIISKRFDADTIHDFRTATKKMRALLRSQDMGKGIFPKPFKEIYRGAGTLRDAQMLLVRLEEEKIKLPGFTLWSATHIGTLEDQWNKLNYKKGINGLQIKLKGIKIEPDKNNFLAFANAGMQFLQSIILSTSPPSDETLHLVRKKLKDLQYVLGWYGKYYPAARKAVKGVSIPALKKLGEQAGDYNDRRIGLHLIDAYLHLEKDQKEIKAAKKYREQQLQKKVKLKETLLREVARLCKRFNTQLLPANTNIHSTNHIEKVNSSIP